MPDHDHDDTNEEQVAGSGRRKFISGLAASGLGVALGSAGTAQGRRRIPLRGARGGTGRKLTLEALTEVTRVDDEAAADSRQAPESAATPRRALNLPDLTPTPRNELLQSLASMPGGPELLEGIGVPPPAPNNAPRSLRIGSPTTGAPQPHTPTEDVLKAGVTLYASGEISPGGFDPTKPPLMYWSSAGWVDSGEAPPNDERVPIRSLAAYENGHTMLGLGIRTPGNWQSYRTYSIEIDFRGLGGFISEWGDWQPTSQGTLVALAQLRGWGDRADFPFSWTHLRRDEEIGFDREFRWMHVIML